MVFRPILATNVDFPYLLREEILHQLVDATHYKGCSVGIPIVTNWCKMAYPSTVCWFSSYLVSNFCYKPSIHPFIHLSIHLSISVSKLSIHPSILTHRIRTYARDVLCPGREAPLKLRGCRAMALSRWGVSSHRGTHSSHPFRTMGFVNQPAMGDPQQ